MVSQNFFTFILLLNVSKCFVYAVGHDSCPRCAVWVVGGVGVCLVGFAGGGKNKKSKKIATLL